MHTYSSLCLKLDVNQFNSLVRSENVYSNKQSPSKDIAYGVARLEHVQYIASGGKFGSGDETLVFTWIFSLLILHVILNMLICTYTTVFFLNSENTGVVVACLIFFLHLT